jgi:hypothetical protein
MKALIAGACITIVAAGAYFGIGGMYAYRAEQAHVRDMRATLFMFATAASGQADVPASCKEFERLEKLGVANGPIRELLGYCRQLNYL